MNLFKAVFIYYPGPAFLGRLFQTRLYHLHPCRRGFLGGLFLFIVILACASMYCVNHWIPACAGMTLRG